MLIQYMYSFIKTINANELWLTWLELFALNEEIMGSKSGSGFVCVRGYMCRPPMASLQSPKEIKTNIVSCAT